MRYPSTDCALLLLRRSDLGEAKSGGRERCQTHLAPNGGASLCSGASSSVPGPPPQLLGPLACPLGGHGCPGRSRGPVEPTGEPVRAPSANKGQVVALVPRCVALALGLVGPGGVGIQPEGSWFTTNRPLLTKPQNNETDSESHLQFEAPRKSCRGLA